MNNDEINKVIAEFDDRTTTHKYWSGSHLHPSTSFCMYCHLANYNQRAETCVPDYCVDDACRLRSGVVKQLGEIERSELHFRLCDIVKKDDRFVWEVTGIEFAAALAEVIKGE